MKVAFTMPVASYERLLQNIPQASATYTLLQRIVLPERRHRARFAGTFNCVLLQCSREEIIPIIGAAKQHCPEAVVEIEDVLWQSPPRAQSR
jgi:hypothetical protein